MEGNPRFGQGSPVKAYVRPGFVQIGQTFSLQAIRFDPHETVKFDIIGPSKQVVSLEPTETDMNGNVITNVSTDQEHWTMGDYIITVTGKSNGQEVAAEAFVTIKPKL